MGLNEKQVFLSWSLVFQLIFENRNQRDHLPLHDQRSHESMAPRGRGAQGQFVNHLYIRHADPRLHRTKYKERPLGDYRLPFRDNHQHTL